MPNGWCPYVPTDSSLVEDLWNRHGMQGQAKVTGFSFAKGLEYVLDFDLMQQTNARTKKSRQVRRNADPAISLPAGERASAVPGTLPLGTAVIVDGLTSPTQEYYQLNGMVMIIKGYDEMKGLYEVHRAGIHVDIKAFIKPQNLIISDGNRPSSGKSAQQRAPSHASSGENVQLESMPPPEAGRGPPEVRLPSFRDDNVLRPDHDSNPVGEWVPPPAPSPPSRESRQSWLVQSVQQFWILLPTFGIVALTVLTVTLIYVPRSDRMAS